MNSCCETAPKDTMKTTIQGLFYQMVEQYPEKIAIQYGEQSVTYAELDRCSNGIAHSILQAGLAKGTHIGIMIEDRAALIACILGVLKAGCLFIPFDSTYPQKRLASMMQDVDLCWMLTDQANHGLIEEIFVDQPVKPEIWLVNDFTQGMPGQLCNPGVDTSRFFFDTTRPPVECEPDDRIYIYFTSGSTGKPKGIVGRYKGLLHFILWEIETFQIDHSFRISQFSTPAFDAFLRDMFVPLCSGGTICIPAHREWLMNGEDLIRWIDEMGIHLIHCVPSVFRLFHTSQLTSEHFQQLRYILMSGERIPPHELKNWYDILGDRVQLVNFYGPSETTMIKVFYRIQPGDQNRRAIPIGQPMKGAKVLILDEKMKPCKTEVIGEIYIRTPYMTHGYYKAPELTQEKFIPNPFSTDPTDLIYRTGDLGRLMPDGHLDFIGRKDNQVKIRGVRVELGDIESQILAHAAIKEVVVQDREDVEGQCYLCAYFVLREPLTVSELRADLAERLPEYMIPSYFIELEKMPLLPNGKIDRKSLPEPLEATKRVPYVAPSNPIEERLSSIYAELLGVEEIGVHDHFFELGGHSLKAVQLIAKVGREFGVKIPLRDFFRLATVQQLAAYIGKAEKRTYPEISVAPESEYYPLSSAQRRLFLLHQVRGGNIGYNMPRMLRLKGDFNRKRFEGAIRALIQRQASLRTSFELVNGEPVQRIHRDVDGEVTYFSAKENELQEMVQGFITPFDLGVAPLFRVGLIRVEDSEDEEYIFLFDMHHMISDGVSMVVLVEEFVRLYAGEELAELAIQYKDYAVWQNRLLAEGYWNHQEAYWLETFQGEVPVLTLPTDYPRPATKNFDGAQAFFQVDAGLSKALYALAEREGATLYMVLLAAFDLLLSRYSGQRDIIVGTPVAGRGAHVDLEPIIGMFVNTLPMRNRPVGEKVFRDFLSEVRENTFKAFENQDYQLDLLIEKLHLQRDLSRNPLFDVMLVLQNTDHATLETGDFRMEWFDFELRRSKFDFILFAIESEQGLFLEMEYSTELYQAGTMNRMLRHYVNILDEVVSLPEQTLGAVAMLSPEERQTLLYDFNNTSMVYPEGKTITELFEEQVLQTPEALALEFEGEQVTYRELNDRSNRLARYLHKKGVQADSVVGLMMERSVDMIVSLLAILKAGGAYLPIDPDYPEDRVLYMLEHSRAQILLTHSQTVREIPFTALQNLGGQKVEITVTPLRPHIAAFDSLPIPDRSLIDWSKYKDKIGMASVNNCISLQATRGCPYHCLYCHKVWSKNHVFRSAENIYEEIEYFYHQGVRNFAFIDDCFNLHRANAERLFRMIIANRLDLQIFFPNGLRGDLLTEDFIDLMIEAGTREINLSLETASPRLQKDLKKFLDLDRFKRVVDYIATKHSEIILELATMHGFPTETEEEAMMTLQFIMDTKWIHFPYIHILKVFPNTEMEEFALANGVQKEDILKSVGLAYHELPETLPFPKTFTRQYQTKFLNEYFLSRERLKSVLPVQLRILSEEALVQKYDAYLPIEVKQIQDVLDFAGIDDFTVPDLSVYRKESPYTIFDRSMDRSAVKGEAKKLLLLDLSQHFSSQSMLYNVAEMPIGLISLMTYLKQELGDGVDGRIYKAGMDFDSYAELKQLIDEYQPDLVGIRTLSFYKEFFHETVSLIRQWGYTMPLITGGPYATSDYATILRDRNVDLVVVGEGEYTFAELIKEMMENGFVLPGVEVLQKIQGIVYRNGSGSDERMREVILLDEIADSLAAENGDNLPHSSNANDLAYVIYTSGSTGKPKGVMVEHQQANNCIFWMQQEFPLQPKDKVVQRTNLTFDPSVWEIFWPLYTGASIRLLTADQSKDAEFLVNLLHDNTDLTIMYTPASLVTGMTYLLHNRPISGKLRLPWFLIGAEPIKMEVVKEFHRYFEGRMVNTYGPTECAINNTYCYLSGEDPRNVVPIGKPISNNQIYILSKEMQMLPIGIPGEICIAGDSVARGYLHHPEKTAEVFVENPFGEGRLYKTGDIGRWTEEGYIEILGRVDDQVKVRGYRIELGEIESALKQHQAIQECVVVVRDPKKAAQEVKICKKCGITTAYPGVTVNEDGVCNVCETFYQYRRLAEKYFKNLTDLKALIEEKNAGRDSEYDCLVLFAGGRGAGFALYTLVEMGLRVMAATYDNEYFSKGDKAAIQMICRKLGVPHTFLTHPKTEEILRESIRTAHTVCHGCFLTSSTLAVDYARRHGIPVVVGATLSRGQIMENKLYTFFKMGLEDPAEIERELATLQRNAYAMDEAIFEHIGMDLVKDGSVYDAVKSVDFYRYCDITNPEMIAALNDRDPYWKNRKNYAIYSTNCPIKQIGDYCHLQERNYHYYGKATSWEKRFGHITVENVTEDLACHVNQTAYENFLRKIQFTKENSTNRMDTKYICAYLVSEQELSVAEMREFLAKNLPDYMIPSHFVTLAKMPLTSNGKIDKHALPEPEGTFNIGVEYVPPQNEVEAKLADVWSAVLGVETIGMNDNFIELGGDSIKAIQLASRINQAGFEVKIKDIFTYQTIAQLALHVGVKERTQADQGVATGEMPLTAVQRWFFAERYVNPQHFHQSVLLALHHRVDRTALQSAFQKLIEHHDTLRVTYRSASIQSTGGKDHPHPLPYHFGMLVYREEWLENEFTLETYDLSSLTPVEQDGRLAELGETIKAGFDLEHGPLIKVALFDLGERKERLLIIIHHLIVDGISWRILLEDLMTAYLQLSRGEAVGLPAKTSSFKEWAEGIVQYSQSAELMAELPYWVHVLAQIEPLPLDGKGHTETAKEPRTVENPTPESSGIEENLPDRMENIHLELDQTLTADLLTRANRAYHTEINDLLLTALAITLTGWSGREQVVMMLEGHGREEIVTDVDIARTIGWFTSMFPVAFDLEGLSTLDARIKGVKEMLRQIPRKGVGYGILKYITAAPELADADGFDAISFNYLGQFDREADTELFAPATEWTGNDVAPGNHPMTRLHFSGLVNEGKLALNLRYPAARYRKETVDRLLQTYRQNLQMVIRHCLQPEIGSYTPSDFPLAQVSQDDLDTLPNGRIADLYGLTPMQDGMLYHYLLDEKTQNYHEQISFRIKGDFQITWFETAWNWVVQNNEVLRTVIRWKGLTQPVQIVLGDLKAKVVVQDLTATPVKERDHVAANWKKTERNQPFCLEDGPNVRLQILKFTEDQYEVILSFHHILFDGWCLGILFGELLGAYQNVRQGLPLPTVTKHRYREYIAWLQRRDGVKANQFWAEYLSGFDTPTTFPWDLRATDRPPVHSVKSVLMEEGLARQLEEMVKQNKVTLNTLFQAAYGLLLQRYNHTDDVVFGATVAGRPADLPGVETMIGLFINTVPVRVRAQGEETVREMLGRLHMESLARQEFETSELTEIKAQSELGREALFETLFVFENYPIHESLPQMEVGFAIDGVEFFEMTNFDFVVETIATGGRMELKFLYNSHRFTASTIDRIAGHFMNLLQAMVTSPAAWVSELPMLSPDEEHMLIEYLNATQADYPDAICLHTLFEAQALRNPEAVALRCKGEELTYDELNRRSNRVAHHLRTKGVGPDQIVGLLIDRTPEMLVGILGILKAGGAYLPISPGLPDDRVQFMLQDSGASVLVTQPQDLGRLEFAGDCVDLHSLAMEEEATAVEENQPASVTSRHLAYVIYTSGSTGRPKGVMVEHRSVVNLIYGLVAKYRGEFGPMDRCLGLTNISFDVSGIEFYVSLLFGGTLVLYDNRDIFDVTEMVQTLVEEKITFVYIPPTLLMDVYALLVPVKEKVWLNKILVGVESIKSTVVEAYMQLFPDLQIVNGYGPTETTICSTLWAVQPMEKVTASGETCGLSTQSTSIRDYPIGANIPIGQPLANTRIIILDRNGCLAPIGVMGELCIAGDGVARGYLNRPELTAERFVSTSYLNGERVYRTGDLARWRPDGNIDFLGRIDQQVKIRGYRIELGEIEAQLLRHSFVREAIVLDQADPQGVKYLVAYLIFTAMVVDAESAITTIRYELAERLPDYMIPSAFLCLDALPMTANGKVDRRALRAMKGEMHRGTGYVAPSTPDEEKMAAIWSEILLVSEVGVNDNFFDLGGHSLRATRLVAQIAKVFHVELPLRQIFTTPTIRELVQIIQETGPTIYASIEPVEERAVYPVSSAQKRLYMVQQIEGANTSYNMPFVMEVMNPLDDRRLEESFRQLIARHESLRTSFLLIEGELVQQIHPEVNFALEYATVLEKDVQESVQNFVRPFDLSQVPLLRVGVIRSEQRQVLILDAHHIIADGVAMGILAKEFFRLYSGEASPPLRLQYKDFAVWQNQFLASNRMKTQEAYWLEQFAGEIPVLNLPTDAPRPHVRTFEGATIRFGLDPSLQAEFRKLAKEQGATLFMALLGVYSVLLARYSGQNDIIVGSPIAGRPHADLEPIIGMFANTLALRNQVNGEMTFAELLAGVKETALRAYENQDYQFEMLVEKLDLQRSLSRNPLFDVMLVLQNANQGQGESVTELELKRYAYENRTAKFDLLLNVLERDDAILFELEYSTRLFHQSTVERMGQHLLHLIREVVANPNQTIATLQMISDEERTQLLTQYIPTSRSVPEATKTIHQLFEEQVVRTPDAQALIWPEGSLTYRELNEGANRLARQLRLAGVGRERIVGIMIERSAELIIGLLAILKAGGAYLPIDPAYPTERVRYMLEDSGAEWLLTQAHLTAHVQFGGKQIIVDEVSTLSQGDEANLELVNTPRDLLYVIYTSGSTGKPKGVMLEHRNLVNLLTFEVSQTHIDFSKVLQYTTISFDVSAQEIFSTLLAGGELYLIPQKMREDVWQLFEWIQANAIRTAFFPVAFVKYIFSEEIYSKRFPNCIRHIVTAGEQLMVNEGLRAYLQENNVFLHNHYGPSETHVVTTLTIAPDGEIAECPTIGQPIANTQIYILNERQMLQPVGVAGELYIGGANVGRGYLHRSELTAEKFVRDPFGPTGARMYRTGDLGRWLPNGEVEFLGRIDHQVKIRGFRVEPGEVESHLAKHPAVCETVVLAQDDGKGGKHLVAYLVTEGEVNFSDLRHSLQQELPDYMVPSYFVTLDRIPLTPNGKVDRKALPTPLNEMETQTTAAPTTATEVRLAEIWSEILGVQGIGVHDHFFELGGHSLRATSLVGRIHQIFQVQLPLSQVFQSPTIRAMARKIEAATTCVYDAIQPVEIQEYYPLSAAQKRLFLLDQFHGANTNYNLSGAFLIEGEIDHERFVQVFQTIIQRHESLRTSFTMINNEPVQRIHPYVEIPIEFGEVEEVFLPTVIRQFIRPFDVTEAPLVRVGLYHMGQGRSFLIYDLHHIIADAVTLNILMREFSALYAGTELAPLRIQYKDFAVWQRRFMQSERMQEIESFWLRQFADGVPVLNLPTDDPRPAVLDTVGATYRTDLPVVLRDGVYRLATQMGVTPNMVMLAAYNVLLSHYSGQESILLGSTIAGRPHTDLEGIIGMFVNTLVLKNSPRRDMSFTDFLAEVKDHALQAYEHQDYPFDELVKQLHPERDLSRNPIVDMLYNFINLTTGETFLEGKSMSCEAGSGLQIEPWRTYTTSAKFDVTLTIYELPETLRLDWNYRTSLFTEATIIRMVEDYMHLLQTVISNPAVQLNEIELVTNLMTLEVAAVEDVEFDF